MGIVVGDTQFEQRVYFCRQTIYKKRNTVDRILYNVGLTWTPVEKWSLYSHVDLPMTVDEGKAKRTFSGKDLFQAIQYAEHLSRKYNFPVNLSM
ncbi:hypothetical protein M5X11_12465 [Paenibacillus alginolyticus]|uniref:hypothetical protein n=1 Tax=Paenibacillus alginolyticus TaxID=59839 RepID=UPI0004927CD7|nr:hypothetical protein [Paenibacillus alginolyticus]MCY9665769.1 hypothetical protein [Paenibacillus alginolyticus]